MRAGITLALVLPGLALAPICPAAGPPHGYSIHWVPAQSHTHQVRVEVLGLKPKALDELRRAAPDDARWQRLLSVYAEQGDVLADLHLPPMLGAYRVDPAALVFEPRFPLEPGVKYRAVFRPDQLPGGGAAALVTATHQLPLRPAKPTTLVRQVYPSADVLPENLLKFYVHFSAPMSRGRIYEHIHLLDDAGQRVELPFLEIDEELWNPDLTRLTLFIDPGRIKRGVLPLEEIGPALEEGRRYTLVIDRAWRDAAGQPLKETFRKNFRVGPPERDPPDPETWKIQPPSAGTRESLVIVFPKPMDHALALRMIRVADSSGALLPGESALADRERCWTFAPAKPWTRGAHRLVVQTTLEDLAGNNIGKPFEVDLFEGVARRLTNETVALPFQVR